MKNFYSIFTVFFSFTICVNSSAQVGTTAPNFTVTDTHGETHTLYDYLENGKTVVLDFFYTTCGPCIFYSPQVNLAYEKYGCNNADAVFIAIDYDDTNAEVMAYDVEHGIQYPSISGLDGGGNSVVSLYNIFGFPTFYVIDPTKTIVQEIDPPTLVVFDFRFNELGIQPADCSPSSSFEKEVKGKISLYPNPVFGNKFFMDIPAAIGGKMQVDIFNCLGNKIKKEVINISGEDAIEFNLQSIQSGHYYLVATLPDGQVYSTSFVKQNSN